MATRISPAFALIAALAVALPATAQKEFGKWPPGTSPKEIGERVANRFASSPHSLSTGEAKQPYINYPESVT
jgi:unsaturated rhamnogalacturonyl hydrolase